MKHLRKYLTPALLVLALFAMNGSEFLHHHDQGNTSDDKCQACIFSQTMHSTLPAESFAQVPLNYNYSEFLSTQTCLQLTVTGFRISGRAPPQISHI